MTDTMKAAVFEGHERIVLEERPVPQCGPNDAIVKVTLTTICGTVFAQGPIGLCATAGARLKGLCPGGKERMRKLMELVRHGRLNLGPLITHSFRLDQIEEAYELFGNQRDGVVKVALTP